MTIQENTHRHSRKKRKRQDLNPAAFMFGDG
jgi:hypothetical protein